MLEFLELSNGLRVLKMNSELLDNADEPVDYEILFNTFLGIDNAEPQLIRNHKRKPISGEVGIKDYIAYYERQDKILVNLGCSVFDLRDIYQYTSNEVLDRTREIIGEAICKAQPLMVNPHAMNCYLKIQDAVEILQEKGIRL